jgi:hypothetical protein
VDWSVAPFVPHSATQATAAVGHHFLSLLRSITTKLSGKGKLAWFLRMQKA